MSAKTPANSPEVLSVALWVGLRLGPHMLKSHITPLSSENLEQALGVSVTMAAPLHRQKNEKHGKEQSEKMRGVGWAGGGGGRGRKRALPVDACLGTLLHP